MIWRMSRWMGCDAQLTRLEHYPSCYGGLRLTVTHECCGSGITEEFFRGQLVSGVMLLGLV